MEPMSEVDIQEVNDEKHRIEMDDIVAVVRESSQQRIDNYGKAWVVEVLRTCPVKSTRKYYIPNMEAGAEVANQIQEDDSIIVQTDNSLRCKSEGDVL